MTKARINLLTDELVAVQNWLTLTNAVRVWAGFALICILITAYFNVNETKLNQQYSALKKKNVQLSNQLEQYEDILSSRVVDPRKENRLSTLKFIFQNKQVLHRQLTDQTQVRLSGFADIMSEIAEHHNREVSLTAVKINDDNISMHGLARNADSVPLWLSGFQNSTFMAGKSFAQFNLSVNEDGNTSFIVSSKFAQEGGG
ncbi:hypothetical protein RI845_16655 [Thalassotalea nanhaiensis]|uniref:PilN domain-containing protein n=1 Tax=Thalassotalea nanhaiensis TaxID=3065648 RepID=A0ABY9TIU6_9GAMM|nr:hypothetical protein RI845_16655 [Colwelliaceae bacterium SQ345]